MSHIPRKAAAPAPVALQQTAKTVKSAQQKTRNVLAPQQPTVVAPALTTQKKLV